MLTSLTSPKRIALSWSSGKDSAWALHLLRQNSSIEVSALMTTFNGTANRVAMHAVRRQLVEMQAERTGIALWQTDLPWPCSNAEYEKLFGTLIKRAAGEGLRCIAFGDLFLEDIRAYRVKQLHGSGVEPLFPVWQSDTAALAAAMIAGGVKARVTCIDPRKLSRSFAGREFNAEFLRDLPAGIDPCGENGEFHTFVYDAPVFRTPIAIEMGEIVERDGFVFADMRPV